jgi:hypothetical protein
VYTELDFPFFWAMTQNNLGNVLRDLGRYRESATAFESAARGYRQAGLAIKAAVARREFEVSRRMAEL